LKFPSVRTVAFAVGLSAAVATATAGSIYLLERFAAQQRAQSALLAAQADRGQRLDDRLARLNDRLAETARRIGDLSVNLSGEIGHIRVAADAIVRRQADLEKRVESALGAIAAEGQRLQQVQSRLCKEIESVPFTITESGSYCLSRSVHHDAEGGIRSAILIAADDVDLDLRNMTIEGPHRNDAQSEGIYSVGHHNLTIRNGTVVGFMYGVRIDPPVKPRRRSGALVVRDLNIVDSAFRGIAVNYGDTEGSDVSVTIADSVIASTGGTKVFKDAFTMAVELVNVLNCRVVRNNIVDVMPTGVGEGVGISLSANNRICFIEDNHLVNSERARWGRTFAFWNHMDNRTFVARGNVATNFTYATFVTTSRQFSDNTFVGMDCSPANTADYYSELQKAHNLWVEEEAECSDSPQTFEKAARAGDPRAQYRMGRIVLERITVEETNETEAMRWFSLAAAKGLEIAERQLSEMRRARKFK
jgi:hypothetical protein